MQIKAYRFKGRSMSQRVYGVDGIAPNLMSGGGSFVTPIVIMLSERKGEQMEYSLRRLTPRECWRLMGFLDGDFSNAETENSNAQLYKQAGNSIARPVLTGIFGNMGLKKKEDGI